MSATVSFIIGYLLGGINPASIFARIKKKNLRESGTKNLGATNTALALGTKYGIAVLALDMLKGFTSVKIAKLLFPQYAVASFFGGFGAVYGHIYPVYMKFKGGKGLAPFGGVILAHNSVIFTGLLGLGIFFVWITDFPIMLTFSATFLAPIAFGIYLKSFSVFAVMAATGGLIIYKHRKNFVALIRGKESRWSEYVKNKNNNNNKD